MPEEQQQQQPPRRRKRPGAKQLNQSSITDVAAWVAASPHWCALAEQAQHLLQTLEREWTKQEQHDLAAAYTSAFGFNPTASTAADDRAWLLQHYQVPPDEEDYGDGTQGPSHRHSKYPARANRGRSQQPWYCASPTADTPMPDIPTKPTGAGKRQGRRS